MKAQLNICLVTKDTPFAKGLELFYRGHPETRIKVCSDYLNREDYDVVVFDVDSVGDCNISHQHKTIIVSDFKNRFQNFNGVVKKTSPHELNDEINLVAKKPSLNKGPKTKFKNVTSRESEILCHLSEGLSTKEISVLCGVSVGTINAHRLSIIQKYGAKNTANLIYTILKKQKE